VSQSRVIRELQSRLPNFSDHLSETIAWCAAQNLNFTPIEKWAMERRKELYRQAGELRIKADRPWQFWFRKSKLGKRATALSAEAHSVGEKHRSSRLRSSALQPEIIPLPSSDDDCFRIVNIVLERRAQELRIQKNYPSIQFDGIGQGRLLLYVPRENLCDGAAEVASHGFFDVDNTPPWDTWTCFFEKYLVSWVPPQLLDLADKGVDVNPEQCIFWAPELGLPT
jgi:hypothetical protein